MSVVISFYRKGWGIYLVVGFVQVLVCSVDGKDGSLYSSRLNLRCVALVDHKQQSVAVRRKKWGVSIDRFRLFMVIGEMTMTLPS